MQLRRLEIVGFKSFANKSTFLFDGNVTVLAGPNGSGKSNVAEAVRWVLGEQRPSALRSRRADEVIFLGSDSRAPVGMAEVSLTMDNSQGRMGVDLDEVRITRRIYRSGESEYLLNGRRVRLRDITERILSVGLGPDNYTVISQGAVDELIAQKPEERRVALENAADVRRHQIQLNETRSRLTTTEENLTRCRDVLAELDPQVRRMRSHADRAARAREARQELQAVSRRLYRHQYRMATQRRAVAEIRQKESAASLEIVEDELQAKEAHWKALESESESLGQELTQADQLVRDLRRQRDALQHELLGAREEQLRIEAETRAIQERQERSQREYDDLSQRSALLKSRTIEAESRREAARQELSRVVEAEREMSGAARARRDTVVASSTHLSQLRAQIERDRRNREVDEQRANELRAHQARTGDERVQLDLASAAAETAVKAATDRAAAHQVELERLESQLIETDHEIARLDAELQGVRTSVRAAEQEQARLEAAHASIDESLERLVTDAAGATLRKARRGVLGVLGPGLRVRDGYERIISAALGDRVGHVVIDDPVAATELTRKVSEADERSALVLAEFNDSSIEASIRDLKASVSRLPNGLVPEFAVDAIECDATLRPVVQRYLGYTLIFGDFEQAAEAADQLASSKVASLPWQLVTRDGHVLRWNGEWRTGSDQRQVRLVAGRAELADIQRRINQSRESITPARAQLDALEQDYLTQVERRSGLRSQAQQARAALNAATRDVEQQRRLHAHEQQARAAADAQHAAADAQLQSLNVSIKTAATRIAEAETAIADFERQRSEAEIAAQDDEGQLTELRNRLAERQRAAAEADAEHQSLAEEARREARLRNEIEERMQALSSGRVELQDRAEKLAQSTLERRKHLETIELRLPDADKHLQSLLANMNQVASRRALLNAEMNEVRSRVRQAQTVHDAASVGLTRATEDLTRLEREIADELEDLGDEHGLQMALTLGDAGDDAQVELEGDPEEIQREVRRLKRELARLGPVDDATVSEYQELIDRHEFLTQQSLDLERASESLRTAMADLAVLIQGGLDATLTEVNSAFQRTFERLFEGGEARLVWSDPENTISSGIDIVAQPPGKRLQPLGNFSGGERALASVALVFALLHVNPTPFCVLDEVDAALDESNVGRFADIIREWSSRTQFIVVTHNRNTMEIADSLFGISMDTHGVSRIVSLKLDEVLAAAEG